MANKLHNYQQIRGNIQKHISIVTVHYNQNLIFCGSDIFFQELNPTAYKLNGLCIQVSMQVVDDQIIYDVF